MTLKEFRKSGILEMYLLGQGSDEEVLLAEEMLRKYPELKDDVNKISNALEAYASIGAITPSSGTKEKIIDKIKQSGPQSKKVKPDRWFDKWNLLLLSGFIVSTILLIAYCSRQDKSLNILQEEFRNLQLECDSIRQVTQPAVRILADLSDPNNEIIPLSPTENFPSSAAYFYSNVVSQKNYLQIINLPVITTDQSYQLWSLKGDQALPLNVFQGEESLLIEVLYESESDAYAITIEPRGGRNVPTLEQLIGVIPIT